METTAADLVELGIPFFDPTAEGVVIQEANIHALKGGLRDRQNNRLYQQTLTGFITSSANKFK